MDQYIRATYGDELEVRVHTRTKQRVIIINIPEGISKNNLEDQL